MQTTTGRGTTRRERTRLIEAHLGLVHRIATQYATSGESRDDLVQVGALALVGAVDRCDAERARLLPAYAARCVEGEILRHLRDRVAPVRIPRRAQELEGRARRARAALERRIGREPTGGELAAAAKLDPAELRAAERVDLARHPVRLDEVDVGAAVDVEAIGLDRALVRRAAQALDDHERRVLLLRFFCDLSQDEIATQLGVSQAHVSRVLARSTVKMRRRLERPSREAWSARESALGSNA